MDRNPVNSSHAQLCSLLSFVCTNQVNRIHFEKFMISFKKGKKMPKDQLEWPIKPEIEFMCQTTHTNSLSVSLSLSLSHIHTRINRSKATETFEKVEK